MAEEVDPKIVRLVEPASARNLLDYVETAQLVAPEIGATAVTCGEGVAAFMGTGSALTTVKGIGSDLGDEEIEVAEAFFRARGARTVTFEVASSISAEAAHRLSGRGYRIVDHEDVVVCGHPQPAPDSLHKVSLVDTDTWPELQLHVNEPFESADWQDLVSVCALLPGAIRVGIHDGGEWIACGELVPAAGAGIFSNDATLPSARGKGAQTALIMSRLDTAANRGFACLMAEVAPGSTSERNYLRCGFEIAYRRAHYARTLD